MCQALSQALERQPPTRLIKLLPIWSLDSSAGVSRGPTIKPIELNKEHIRW